MKKLMSLFAILLIVVSTFAQEIKTTQIAFGAIGVDSVAGGAPAGGTTKYFYFNTLGTKAGGASAATAPIQSYEVAAVSVNLAAHSSPIDSAHVTLEVSCDNVNWFKYVSTSASTNILNTGTPVVSGAASYWSGGPYVTKFTGAASGVLFLPNKLYTPYLRVKVVAFKAATYAYVKAYVTLKKIH